eukprot:scaffold4412_cov401-Prasinococcus_capsulatus_cf.AAC.3
MYPLASVQLAPSGALRAARVIQSDSHNALRGAHSSSRHWCWYMSWCQQTGGQDGAGGVHVLADGALCACSEPDLIWYWYGFGAERGPTK